MKNVQDVVYSNRSDNGGGSTDSTSDDGHGGIARDGTLVGRPGSACVGRPSNTGVGRPASGGVSRPASAGSYYKRIKTRSAVRPEDVDPVQPNATTSAIATHLDDSELCALRHQLQVQ